MYKLQSPFMKFKQQFDKIDDAHDFARKVLKQDNDIKFISIYQGDNGITTLIKSGYEKHDFFAFKLFDKINAIDDYFILKLDGKRFYFIKTKKHDKSTKGNN